jgi:hypothetical protein
LEERARQVIRERAVDQSQPATATSTPSATPAPAQAQQQAIEATRQAPVQNNAPPAGLKAKRERIREITELYRADKMSSAEYHQRRAQILAEPD